MPNGTDDSILSSSIKASTGVQVPTDQNLQQNNFNPIQIETPDVGQNFQTTQTVNNFGLDAPNLSIPSQPSTQSTIDSVINQNFQSSNITSSSGASFNTAILNRAVTTSLTDAASNSASVQTDGSNVFSSTFLTGMQSTINNILQSNVLNDYDNITYHFKLMLAQEGDLINNDIIPTTNLYIVAESGVSTTFSIKNVDIESIIAPNNRTKNTVSSIFKVQIVENHGISLIDKLFQAASQLSIKNIMNIPMLLELSFKGYTTDGIPQEVPIAKRSWRLQLMDMPTKLDITGSEYELNFVSINDYGFHRFASAAIIKQQISYSVETIGDFFDNLGYFLTLQDALIASKGDQTRNEYQFVVQPDMRNWVIGQLADTPNVPSMFIDNDGKRSVVLKPGHTIQDIIDNIFATTIEANEKANPKSAAQKMNEPQQGDTISKILNLSCENKILGFNPKNSEYVRRFIYYINLYDAFRALPDKPDNADQTSRIEYMLQDALRKKYSYIFTNDNTEVLNLNLELNNLWRHAATYYTTAMHRSSNNSSNFSLKDSKDISNIDDVRGNRGNGFSQSVNTLAISDQNAFKPDASTTTSIDPSFTNIDTSEDANELTPRMQQQQRLADLQAAGSPNTSALQSAIAAEDQQDNIIPLEGLNTSSIIPGIASVPQLDSFIGPAIQRILSPSTIGSTTLIETLPGVDAQNPLLNMFIKQSDPALDVNRVNENLETTTDFSRTIFGIITNQMYSGVYSDLLQIELDVRGDPFWLGETDGEVIKRLQAGTTRTPSNGQYANYLRGENSFFLTFNTPQNYDESTGFVDTRQNTTFAGVYNVNQVNHSFAEGKFTQRLVAIRDINIDPNQIKKYVS